MTARQRFRTKFSADEDPLLLNFRGHYDRTRNECLVLVENRFTLGFRMSWEQSWAVSENDRAAEFSQEHVVDGPKTERIVMLSRKARPLNRGSRALSSFVSSARARRFRN
jgi:hypothetical protein